MIKRGAPMTLKTCVTVANKFMLSKNSAKEIINKQVSIIKDNYDIICSEANLSTYEQELFKNCLFLNSDVFEEYEEYEE